MVRGTDRDVNRRASRRGLNVPTTAASAGSRSRSVWLSNARAWSLTAAPDRHTTALAHRKHRRAKDKNPDLFLPQVVSSFYSLLPTRSIIIASEDRDDA